MNLKSLVVVALRLIALNFLLRVVLYVTPQIFQFFDVFYRRSQPDGSSPSVAIPLLLVGGLFVSAVLLWVFALPLARLVTREVSEDLSFPAMSLADCYSVAFMVVGLGYMAIDFPAVLSWMQYLFKAAASTSGNAWTDQVTWYVVAQTFIPFIVGVLLFVNGRKWAVALARKQTDPPAPPAAE